MAERRNWTRNELLVVLNLYHKLRFGQFDEKQPVVIDVATHLDRSSGSVAMKLSNLASLDPVLKLRGIKGLKGASNLDRDVWDEYHGNPAEIIPLSQERFDALFVKSENEITEVLPGVGIRCRKRLATEVTETIAPAKRRHGQDYFRDIVLNNYAGRCGITGNPIRELLIASHILPWSSHEAERLNVRNGICLNRLHDAAFDQGLVSFDEECRLIISPKLKSHLPQKSLAENFEAYVGIHLRLPEDGMQPDPAFLMKHRERFATAGW